MTISMTQLTPLSFLERAARVWPAKTAIVNEERRLTYAEFGARAEKLAAALSARGVETGDRVAYLMPNVTEMLVGHFGVPLSGAVLVAINTRLSPDEVAYILRHCEARMLVVDARYAATAEAAIARIGQHESPPQVVVSDSSTTLPPDWTPYESLLSGDAPADIDWSVTDEHQPISINYTSGTTGRPKGVVYTHRGAYLNALGELLHSQHSSESVYLWTLPMFHCNGWCTPWAVTAIGGRHVCLPEVRGEAIWRLIAEEGVTHLNAAPTVLTMLMNSEAARPLTAPVRVTTAGAPPSPTTIAQMESLHFRLVHVYGLTETYGPYAVCEEQDHWAGLPAEQRARLKARQGVGMIQADRLRVVDEHMRDVPADGRTLGEIVMRGNNVMAGYFEDPDATAEAFRGGWFHSGDLGVVHADGYVELRDRAKDVVISGGENISSVEVEQALMSHAAVLEAAVVGVPDEKWGERPKAYVIVRTDHQVTEADLINHVRSRLAHYKAPREVALVTELPKTSTGKIQKFMLRDLAWAGRTSRIQG